MYEQTMNNDVTLTGGENPLLAGRYHVVRQLGTGGMGSVWLAEDRQLDNKLFAVKMLPSILVANKRAYRKLKDEALVAMKLVHPNIVQIRAFEENNGNPFLVMDYIEGQTLDDCLEEWGTLSEEETVALLKPVAEALDYAHLQGVVHRDIKPSNVMIRTDGTPFVLDFGIAREIQETMTHVTGKLSSGTLLYMSPEQLRGQPPNATQDVYSFAAMAYECLKGEPPFSRGQIEYQIINESPESLWGGDLAASIMKALSKDPNERPGLCSQVLFPSSRIYPSRIAQSQKNKQLVNKAQIDIHRRNAKWVVLSVIIGIVVILVPCCVIWNQRLKSDQDNTIALRQATESIDGTDVAAQNKTMSAQTSKREHYSEVQERMDVQPKREVVHIGQNGVRHDTIEEFQHRVQRENKAANTKRALYIVKQQYGVPSFGRFLRGEEGDVDWEDKEIQYWAGAYYYEEAKNYRAAAEWFNKSSEQGFAKAQYNLGVCYYNGSGVVKDYSKAVFWLKKAADQSDVDARYLLGVCYYYGRGVVQNHEAAVVLWRKAAEVGLPKAQNNLGDCYENGIGVAKDIKEAIFWYRKAANQGHQLAKKALRNLAVSEKEQ